MPHIRLNLQLAASRHTVNLSPFFVFSATASVCVCVVGIQVTTGRGLVGHRRVKKAE